MAKKKSLRIKSTKARNSSAVVNMPVRGGFGLPVYQPFLSTSKFTFFFEHPEDKLRNEFKDSQRIAHTKKAFCLVSDGKELIGEDFAKQIASVAMLYLQNATLTQAKNLNSTLKRFVEFLSSNEQVFFKLEEMTFEDLVNFITCQPSKVLGDRAKHFLVNGLAKHQHFKQWDLTSISHFRQAKTSISDTDFDTLTDEVDYSDREMTQILAYCYYEIEKLTKHFDDICNVSEEGIGDKLVGSNKRYSRDDVLKSLILNEDYEGLRQNLLLETQWIRKGKEPTNRKRLLNNKIYDLVYSSNEVKAIGGKRIHDQFKENCKELIWSEQRATYNDWLGYFRLETIQPEFIIALYLMIATGKNGEVIFSLARNYGKNRDIPWYENYDISLGVSKETSDAQKCIRLVGTKRKGKKSKPISIRIPIKSPIFTYLKLLDDINNNPEREFFFSRLGNTRNFSNMSETFLKSYPVVADDGSLLKRIQVRRLRKTFSGHLLLKIVEDVEDGEDLISKLRTALDHKSFDTTLFSYILKTGSGNHVLNSAIVALTSDMLDKALHFQGKVCENPDKKDANKELYLCDCTDDTKPTHNIPIASRCRKYDMCLGCERSEVYSHHLKNIYFRIMQYDEIAMQNPLTFSGLLEDRRQIAHDTIERFKKEHSDGVAIADEAFQCAAQAYQKGELLVPPILQFR